MFSNGLAVLGLAGWQSWAAQLGRRGRHRGNLSWYKRLQGSMRHRLPYNRDSLMRNALLYCRNFPWNQVRCAFCAVGNATGGLFQYSSTKERRGEVRSTAHPPAVMSFSNSCEIFLLSSYSCIESDTVSAGSSFSIMTYFETREIFLETNFLSHSLWMRPIPSGTCNCVFICTGLLCFYRAVENNFKREREVERKWLFCCHCFCCYIRFVSCRRWDLWNLEKLKLLGQTSFCHLQG